MAIINENEQIIVDGKAVSDKEPMPVELITITAENPLSVQVVNEAALPVTLGEVTLDVIVSNEAAIAVTLGEETPNVTIANETAIDVNIANEAALAVTLGEEVVDVNITNETAIDVNDITVIKGAPAELFGGAISASVLEAAATVINITAAIAGALEVVVNSGAGTWVIALYGHNAATGVFTPCVNELGVAIEIAIAGSAIVNVQNLRSKYIKFVPTLTGESNITCNFTPCIK
jgi:hypothetical protein